MSTTGRYYVTTKEGRRFCVEPVSDGHHQKWGDVNPSTGELGGDYGRKGGSIKPSQSIISEANGFKNIVTLEAGQSPDAYIDSLLG